MARGRDEWMPWAVRTGHLDAPFATDGTTVGEVLSLATSLRSLAMPAVVCVASQDRVQVAAALLAALTGGPRVIFPHAFSPAALREVSLVQAFTHWVGPSEWTGQVQGERAMPEPARGTAFEPGDPEAVIGWLFTGGSTGRPQLWAKAARQLLSESAMLVRTFAIAPADRIVATASPCHIYGLLFSVLVPLLSGAVVEREAAFFPQAVVEGIERLGATVLVSTPAHLRALAGVTWPASRPRIVFSSGAPLLPPDAAALLARTGLRVHEVYGSTETGGIAVRVRGENGPLWKALPGVALRLSDDRIAVRSSHLGDELPRDGEGYFVTADRARAVGADRFELLGRADGVVKVAGKRVDLFEIEEKLRALPGVADAVVVARPDASGRGQQIVALVESLRPSAELMHALRDTLPSAAWPRVLQCVPSIPVTGAGKRDHDAIDRILSEVDK